MKIKDKFGTGKTVFSLEVFPPKKDKPVSSITGCLEGLKAVNPDFISVTYGAGGNAADRRTVDIAGLIQNTYNITAMAHLTCVTSTRPDVLTILGQLREQNVENILALRGDITPGAERKNDFRFASDLAQFISQNGDFGISGACYPEMHTEAENFASDIAHLKIKIEAGVSHLVSQLFFDNKLFYDFREKLAIAGINVPIEAGIMPVTNARQIENMVTMCGASLPAKFSRVMNKYGHNPEALKDAGIAYAGNQITDLLASGVDGIHLYTMNNAEIATRIYSGIKNLL
ncbi:MAG: methylenetetrahydrofolate reductase [NAD(P)H] [Ruminococcus sp.]|jgi:methylenetetrahydrofolate reductase (NADPH)|nr:methylenetetrahydrofolate reductase [NAD(P)H] [Ruminococcus sp.]